MKTARDVVPRELAIRDVEAAVDYYRHEASDDVAFDFIERLRQAYTHIGRHPASGSLRVAHDLNIPGLRCWPLRRYPYVIFYVEREASVDVWRVLHAHRDLPAWVQVPGTDA